MLVLQSSTDPLYIPSSSSSDTYGTSSDCAYYVGNVKDEEGLDMQEVEKVNVKTEKGIGSEEEECIGIVDEEGIYSEEEEEEVDIDTKEGEVSIEDAV
jgi:hypothetical protein